MNSGTDLFVVDEMVFEVTWFATKSEPSNGYEGREEIEEAWLVMNYDGRTSKIRLEKEVEQLFIYKYEKDFFNQLRKRE